MKASHLIFLFVLFFASCVPEDDTVITPTDTDDSGIIDENIEVATTLVDRFDDPEVADYTITKTRWLVQAGLTIEPGVVIAFESDVMMRVVYDNGFIQAVGTTEKPIRFTGKINNPGYWRGIVINSADTRNELNHCIIEYGGGDELEYTIPFANIGVIDHAGTVGRLKLKNTIVQHSAGAGLVLNRGAKLQEFSANTFSNNDFAAVQLPANEVAMLDNSTTYISANGFDGVEILDSDLEETNEESWKNLGGAPYKILGDIRIKSGLVIDPGALFKMEANTFIRISYPNGYLTAEGTADARIAFEGLVNDMGFWKGIVFNSADSRNKMNYCTVAHGGGDELEYVIDHANIGVIDFAGVEGKLQMTNCIIDSSAGCGVATNSDAQLTESDNLFTNITASDFCE